MRVENLSEIAFNQRRKLLLEWLPEAFRDLDPAKVTRDKANSLFNSMDNRGRVYVIGFGKAAFPMYCGVREALSVMIESAWIIVPDDEMPDHDFRELTVLGGTHPRTGSESERSTSQILEHVSGVKNEDTVVVLISGGGSALFEKPVKGVSIDDLADLSECFMDSGADIYELNTMRKHFSSVKGGKLANILYPARVIGITVSDVFGDDPGMIASGPLTETVSETLDEVIGKYGGKCPAISSIKQYADPPVMIRESERVEQHIVLRNSDFTGHFSSWIRGRGEACVSLGSLVNGDVGEVAGSVSVILGELRRITGRGFWFTFGGETTVDVRGSGRGGRNQELALRLMMKLRGNDFTVMCIGTDGIDGHSPAMGGIVDSELAMQIHDDEMEKYLSKSDSFTLLEKYRSAVLTGRTGTNVSDICVGYFGSERY